MAVADHFDSVQQIYIAFYQRPADPAGLRYWAERVEVAGGDTGAVIDAFAASEEAQELYGDITNENIGQAITDIYQALFGREPDAAGRAYYEQAFANGEMTAGTIALSILDGAQGEDTIAINNKLEVANEFTQQVAGQTFEDANFGQGSNFAVTYNEEDTEAARAILADVTAAPGSVLDATAVRQALREQIANEGDDIEGSDSVLTLTTDVDTLQGTQGNDTFQGILGAGANGTVQTFDSIDGGAGTDTLNLLVRGNTGVPSNVGIRGIEVVNLISENGNVVQGDGVDAEDFGTAAQQIWQINAATDISNLKANQTAGFRNVQQLDATVEFDVEAGTVVLENLGDDSDIYFAGETLTTATVSGSIAQNADAKYVETLNVHDHTENAAGTEEELIETLNVSLTTRTAIDLQGEFSSLVTFNATESKAGILVDLSDLTDLETANFGDGADEVSADVSGTAATTFNLGAGNDVFEIDGTVAAGADAKNSLTSVTLGAGNDTFAITTGLSNIVNASKANFAEGLITVTDFDAEQDVFNVSGLQLELATLDNTEIGNIRDAASLYDAIQLAASFTAVGTDDDNDPSTPNAGDDENAVLFTYADSAYLFVDNDNSGTLNAGDGLVQLVGVTANEFDAQSFVA